MNWTSFTLIAALAAAVIVVSMVIANVVGLTILFTHTFPKTPHGI